MDDGEGVESRAGMLANQRMSTRALYLTCARDFAWVWAVKCSSKVQKIGVQSRRGRGRSVASGDDFEDIHKTKWSDYHGISLIVGDESKIVTLEHPKTGKIFQD